MPLLFLHTSTTDFSSSLLKMLGWHHNFVQQSIQETFVTKCRKKPILTSNNSSQSATTSLSSTSQQMH